jgi:predicted transport protein
MPIFQISGNKAIAIAQTNFKTEKELQLLVERNLEPIFNCRLVATEFPTGAQHAGRIDTLGLSEDNNPVIIEYKKVESSDLINQSLFYLSWIHDHRGDFQVAVQKTLGSNAKVDWSDVRVICLAPNYKKYDLHAVQVMGANIELWRYRLFANSTMYIEEVFRQSIADSITPVTGKDPIMVSAGKKAARTRAEGVYTFQQHLIGKSKTISELAIAINDYILSIDSSIEATPKKFYIAYKISQNIVCLEVQKKNIRLYLKLESSDIKNPPSTYRNVSNIGHYGTGNVEFTVKSNQQFKEIIPFINLAYNKVGG